MKNNVTDTSRKENGNNGISFTQYAAYGAGGIIPIALFNIAGILVGLMGNISLGLSAFWLGLILIIPRLWDALSDPVIGHLSDNTRTRWGRRRPFLLIGGILVAVFFVVMWWIPKGDMVKVWFPTEAGFHVFQLIYILVALLLFFTACNIFEIPHGALGMEMTTDYHERTKLFSIKSFVGNLFAMSTPWLFKLANLEVFRGPGGNEADGMRYVSLMIAAILIPLSFWWFFKLREPGFKKVEKQKKTPFWQDIKRTTGNRNFIMLTLTIFTLAMGFNFVQLLGSYIPIFYIFGGDKDTGATILGIQGTVWAITGLLAVFPLNIISPRLGKRNTLFLAIVLMVMAQLSKIFCYNPAHPYWILMPTVLLSSGMLFFFTLGSSMVGDICDEDELKTGQRSEGSYYSIFWWFIKMGTALASFVGGVLIVITMFDEGQVTRVDSLQGNIREMRSRISEWTPVFQADSSGTLPVDQLRELSTRAFNEAKEYQNYLQKEVRKDPDPEKELSAADVARISTQLESALVLTEANLAELQDLQRQLSGELSDTSRSELTDRVFAASQGTMLEKARMNSLLLLTRFDTRSVKSEKSREHYQTLITTASGIYGDLSDMTLRKNYRLLDDELAVIEKEVKVLTRQTPYTLLMMRVLEIGLPIFLSIFSVFFVFRYSLTEKRSMEIKEELRRRNQELMGNAAGV
ncbi:MAG: MFS transporter [Bacteroidota bacterium]